MQFKTAPKEFFQEVIDEAKAQGLELIAWVTLNSKRNQYHVDWYRYVQNSRLFFRAPGRTFIVMLEFTEKFGKRVWSDASEFGETWDENFTESHWSGHLYIAYSWKRFLEKELETKSTWDHSLDELHFQIEPFFIEGPFKTGWSSQKLSNYHWSFEEKGHLGIGWKPEEVVGVFGSVLNSIRPFLFGRFIDLQVTDFPPHYTFPGCDVDFWAKFPMHRLYGAVKGKVWGSDFRREPVRK